jgi:hypothetical protein
VNGGADVPTMPQILATERLILRQFRRDDADDVNSFADDPAYRRSLGPDHPAAADFLANNVDADWSRAPSWAIELDGRVVGGVFLGVDAVNRRAELAGLTAPAGSIAAMERLGMRRDDAPAAEAQIDPLGRKEVRYVLDRDVSSPR